MNERKIIDYSYENKLSHIGSCLTALPIIEEIYKIKKPDEKFVLSSGHAHLAHAVVMASQNPGHSIDEYMEAGIHCDQESGCDVSTGSLGQGLPISLGIALADRSKNVYCLISDGECAEGSIWEALRLKTDLNVDNLKVYVNCNGYGAYDPIDVDKLEQRLLAFCPDINIRITHVEGQADHYEVLTKEEYENL